MRLNELKPATGSRKKHFRVGRGIGSGNGKTAGRGHKGQRARAGGFHRIGFEGGQMPLQRRLPKFGFISLDASSCAQIRLHELEKVSVTPIDIKALKEANLITKNITRVKVIASGVLTKAVKLKGIAVTAGAKAAIEAAGGKIEN
jgi:large subunit ribosomal protein L15